MKRYLLCLLALGAIVVTGCEMAAHHDDDDDNDGTEVSIPLDQVPPAVMTAAKKAVPGAKFVEAETEVENGVRVYCLAGTADGEPVEVEVSAAGKVLEIERGDEEDGPRDDDD